MFILLYIWAMQAGLHTPIAKASDKYEVPASLIRSICFVESSYRPNAVNLGDGGPGNHSIGVCQVSYQTALQMGMAPVPACTSESKTVLARCPLMDPTVNIDYAAKYLAFQMKRYGDNLDCVISAYNAGTCLKKSNRSYVLKVLSYNSFITSI